MQVIKFTQTHNNDPSNWDIARSKLGNLGVNDFSTLESQLRSKAMGLIAKKSEGVLSFELTHIPTGMSESGLRGLINSASYSAWKPELYIEDSKFTVSFKPIIKRNSHGGGATPASLSRPNPIKIIQNWYSGGTPLGLPSKPAQEMNKRIILGQEVEAQLDPDPKIPRNKLEYIGQGEAVFGTAKDIENLVTFGLGECICIVVFDENKKEGLMAHLDTRPKVGLMGKLLYRLQSNGKLSGSNIKAYIIGVDEEKDGDMMFKIAKKIIEENKHITLQETNIGMRPSRGSSVALNLTTGLVSNYNGQHEFTTDDNRLSSLPSLCPQLEFRRLDTQSRESFEFNR